MPNRQLYALVESWQETEWPLEWSRGQLADLNEVSRQGMYIIRPAHDSESARIQLYKYVGDETLSEE